MKKGTNHIRNTIFLACFSLFYFSGCKKFIEVDPPITSTNAGNVYNSDVTAAAVLTGIYTTLAADENNPSSGFGGLNYLPSLAADELGVVDNNLNSEILGYYRNSLRTDQSFLDPWSRFYDILFRANSAIEGISASEKLTPIVKTQLLGESYFMRAFCLFSLTNLYGDIPLIISTDYKVNSLLARTPATQVYKQIKEDLLKAEKMLGDHYRDGTLLATTVERVRPNKYVAYAFLARVYLYTSDWQNAEAQASLVIDNIAEYDILPLNEVFLKNSKETIWALQPTGNQTDGNTGAGKIFILPDNGPSISNFLFLNEDLLNSFEILDKRRIEWVNHVTAFGITYHYPYKYKIGGVNSATLEYPILFRLGEQYLIRAEARARQNRLTGSNSSKSDLDIIRFRAGLVGTTATTQSEFLSAIMNERRHELFAEWGHRWLDLKRTNTIDAVMTEATVKKGGIWKSEDALYPIPLRELQNNPRLVQNEGY